MEAFTYFADSILRLPAPVACSMVLLTIPIFRPVHEVSP